MISEKLKTFISMLEQTDKNDLCGIMPCQNICQKCPIIDIDEIIEEIQEMFKK